MHICHILQTRNSIRKVDSSRNVFEAKIFATSDRNCYLFPGFTVAGNGADIDSFIGYNMSGHLFSTHVLVLR